MMKYVSVEEEMRREEGGLWSSQPTPGGQLLSKTEFTRRSGGLVCVRSTLGRRLSRIGKQWEKGPFFN